MADGKLAKFRFVARLPAYCRVNPNLPTSIANQRLTIVRGIDRSITSTVGAAAASSQPTSGGGVDVEMITTQNHKADGK